MKVVVDISVTSLAAHPVGPQSAWDAAWASPITGTNPALVMDFAAGVYGSGGISAPMTSVLSLARNSDATRTDQAGTLELLGPDIARIDHDPNTFAPRGVLLEMPRTNLIAQSGTPANQSVAVTAVPHVLSFYGAGTVGLSNAHSATIIGAGSYPARTIVTFTPTAGNLDLTFAGDVFAPQLEQGTEPSSYVPTAATSVQREADVASVSLGPWFDASQGTLVLSGSLDGAVANDRILELDTGATATRLSLLWNTVLGKPQFQVWDASVLQAAIAPAGNSIALGDHFRVAMGFAADDFAISLNGSAVASDTSGSMPTGLTTLRLGRSIWGAQGIMVCEGLTYYPTRLSDAEIQALSA